MFHLTKSLTDCVHKALCSAVLYYPSFQITDSDLNITVNECELIETYKALHPITAKYSFFFFQVHVEHSPRWTIFWAKGH